MNRKAFLTTLGTAGLGLGLVVAAVGGVPLATAQEDSPSTLDERAERIAGLLEERLERRAENYVDFTAALANELGIASADEVDAAIRVAMMTVVDARVDEGLLTSGQAEAINSLIADADVPLAPGPMFGSPPGVFMRGEHGPGGLFPGRAGDDDTTIRIGGERRAEDGVARDARGDDVAEDEDNESS